MTETRPSRWQQWAAQLRQLMQARQAHAARTVVLLPYAQLLPLAQRAWAQICPDGFAPRFETTQSWCRGQPVAPPGEHDYRGDVAFDALTGRELLERAGLREHAGIAAPLLLQSMPELAQRAAALPPAQRASWAQRARLALSAALQAEELRLEAAVAQVAVSWAGYGSYPSDGLFASTLREDVDCLVLVPGLQPDPLRVALRDHWGARCAELPLPPAADAPAVTLHAAQDMEDEAQRAAACVLRHLQAGRAPVAVAVIDRLLTRRLRALLAAQGVALRDETGWKLSTSRAAAQLMATLRAAAWDAGSDVVLDWLKQLPALPADFVSALEAQLRRRPQRGWRTAAALLAAHAPIAQAPSWPAVQRWRAQLQGRRSLGEWLDALRAVCCDSGLWDLLEQDRVGAQVLTALRLQAGAARELAGRALQPMDLPAFTHWVDQVLEAASFQAEPPAQEQAVLLPLAHLLGREFAAVVMPGCDELRLPASAEPAGLWTAAQRELLGLAARPERDAALRLSWLEAVSRPCVDVLWRCADETGEALMPSPLVQLLQLQGYAQPAGADPRGRRALAPAPAQTAPPRAPMLAQPALSASAYDDLRHCPYRYFALRLLGLREAEELETELDARDVGDWVHAILQRFHARLDQPGAARAQRRAWLDEAADAAAQTLDLAEDELLPYRSAWPRLREGYLDWLAAHEAEGWRYAEGEWKLQRPCGDVILQGRIDRLDRGADGSVMLLDYKTEGEQRTRDRLKEPLEDTQLAFYAALHGGEALRAAYVNVSTHGAGEKPVQLIEHPDVAAAREALLQGVQQDLARIAAGAELPALGEGPVCDYCAARGLCRKDFRASPEAA
ncbi:MAG: PD-(D/E)XK nuclease family protein [Hylemonella sp.]